MFLHCSSFSEINKEKLIICNAHFGTCNREMSILMLNLKIFTAKKEALLIFHLCILKHRAWSGNIFMSCFENECDYKLGSTKKELINWRAIFFASYATYHLSNMLVLRVNIETKLALGTLVLLITKIMSTFHSLSPLSFPS